MFTKKQYRILIVSAIFVFIIMSLLIYMLYMGIKEEKITEQPQEIDQVTQSSDPIGEGQDLALGTEEAQGSSDDETEIQDQAVMAQHVPKIKAGTKVEFEIVDQFGLTTQTTSHEGIHWLDYTKPELSSIYPDYVITKYDEDFVTLTKVIEREVEPNYILTTYDSNIVISIDRDGHKMFYKETGLGQHDLSDILEELLERGIPITPEQKDAILENADEVYMILQEHDE